MRRDGNKENPASIRCLTMLLRCLHDSSTDPPRLLTAALRFISVEPRIPTNVHDASTIRYGASTIQDGSVTTSHKCARFSGSHMTVCHIMTPKSEYDQESQSHTADQPTAP